MEDRERQANEAKYNLLKEQREKNDNEFFDNERLAAINIQKRN